MDVNQAKQYLRQAEINKRHKDVVDLAQERLFIITETIKQIEKLPLEERRSHETIQLILRLLKVQRESLISVQMIFPHDKGAEAIKEVDGLIARYERMR